jgi:hypothetical protein
LLGSHPARQPRALQQSHQKRKQWIDDFRTLYAEFWKDADVSRVRRWIISNKLYDQVLKPVLIKRNQNSSDLNEDEGMVLDDVDKFIAVIIRLEALEETRMTRRQRALIQKLFFSRYWKTAAASRPELRTYISRDWAGEITLPDLG